MALSEYCKATLYGLVFTSPLPHTVVYIQAGSKVAAIRKAMDALMCLNDVTVSDLTLTHVAAYSDLVALGTADEEGFRVFETAWHGGQPDEWVAAPLFLSNDKSLLGNYAAWRLERVGVNFETTPKRAPI